MSLEQIVRPFQVSSTTQRVPVTGGASEPIKFTILADSGVKTFIGEAVLTTTVYTKKRPKEREF